MSASSAPLAVKVWGDYAVFTRPEMKVERLTYPVMTPSAARGILESIFWKPEMEWRIEEIWVLNPVRYFSILRNEVNSRASERAARGWEKSGVGGYDATNDRAQRHTLGLRCVAYIVRAHVALRPGVEANVAKYRDQFRRRVERGQCFATPYLGTRECSAFFAPPDGTERPCENLTDDLGLMLYDLDYAPDGSGRGTPRFFRARVERGVLRPPPAPRITGGA